MNYKTPPLSPINLNKLNLNTPSPKKYIEIPNAPDRVRRLKIKEKNIEENDFILDIDKFNITIDNYTLKVHIDLIILNKVLDFIYNSNTYQVNDINNVLNKVVIDYTEKNYFLLNICDKNNNSKYYQLKFIDINDTCKFKLIYEKIN